MNTLRRTYQTERAERDLCSKYKKNARIRAPKPRVDQSVMCWRIKARLASAFAIELEAELARTGRNLKRTLFFDFEQKE